MRPVAFSLVLVAVLLGPAAWAVSQLNVYELNTSNAQGEVGPGGTFDFWVRLTTQAGDNVVGLAYDILLQDDDWSLQWRHYQTYGWFMNDGWYDASVPMENAAYPVTVNNGLWNITPSDPDFHYETARADLQGLPAGTYTAEDFRLKIPSDTPLGTYLVSVQNPLAFDRNGMPVDITVGDAFRLKVVPEPGTLALFGAGALGAVLIRRRRRRD